MNKYTGEDYDAFHKDTSVQSKIIGRDNFTYRHILQQINTYIDPSMSVLDIGCGAGTLALYLAEKGNNVVGIDISEKAIKDAQKSAVKNELKNVQFKVVDFPTATPEGKYDAIICTEVIEHLYDDELAIKKMSNLLRSGGILILSTPSQNAPLYRLGLAKKFDKRVGHLRRYTFKELEKMLKKNDFIITREEKVEGVIRNFLFVNRGAGKLVRYVKFFIADIVTFFDGISLKLFGESNLFIIARKK